MIPNRVTARVSVLLSAIFILCIPAGVPDYIVHAQELEKTVADGVYTDAQAIRGSAAYDAACVQCHRADLSGADGPALRAERFTKNFAGKDLKTLYTKMATTMPRNIPGSLSDDVYLDILAHVLRENGFPSGTRELTAEMLSAVRVLPGRAKPPPPVGDFSYVEVAGCLAPGPDGTWLLTNATEPVSVVVAPGAVPKPSENVLTSAPGNQTFHLLDAMAYNPQSYKGQKDVRSRPPHQAALRAANDHQLVRDARNDLRALMAQPFMPGSGSIRICVIGAIAFALAAVAVPSAQEPVTPTPRQTRTVWDGVYNLTQVARGEAAYSVHCAGCHREDLAGYDGLLRGQRFMDRYREASLHLLFDKTKTTMPRNAAGTLTDQAYVDIVAYVLKSNEFPDGAAELRVEDLSNVRLVGKAGAEPVPDFSLIKVVGCLGRSGDAWMLTNATDPVRTGDPQPPAGELAEPRSTLTGTGTFRLLISPAYTPANNDGRGVEVRGFLIRRPNEDRINITSIETVGPSCRAR